MVPQYNGGPTGHVKKKRHNCKKKKQPVEPPEKDGFPPKVSENGGRRHVKGEERHRVK